MPQLSKKKFVKSQKTSAFKPPLLTKENIEKVLGKSAKPTNSFNAPSSKNSTISSISKKNTRKKAMSIELSFEEHISGSQHSDISYRMNEPAIKDAYIQFVKNLREPMNDTICSTPLLDKHNESEDIFTPSRNISVSDEEIKVQADKASGDSGLPPSQETLQINETEEKHPLSMDMKQMEELNFMKNFKEPAKKKTRKIYSVSLSEGSEKLNTPEKVKESSLISQQPAKKVTKKIAEPFKKQVFKKRKGANKSTKQKTLENGEREIAEPSGKNEMPLFDKMLLIQESRNVGLYSLCDSCDKARYLPDVKDPLDLPEKWYCYMNPDPKHNKCSDPEEDPIDEEFLIDNLYNAGSVVWAKMDGYPWWPAMVEDDPDSEDYFYLEKKHGLKPTYYHVTFFDSYDVTRAWIRPKFLKPFKINKTNPEFAIPKFNKFRSRVEFAFEQAEDAVNLSLFDRLRKYSFIQRYTKPLSHKVKEKSNKVVRTKKQGSESLFGKKKQRVCKKLLSSDDENNSNISVILNNMDWQNDNINLNIIEKFL